LKWLKEKEKSKELSALKKLKEEGGGGWITIAGKMRA